MLLKAPILSDYGNIYIELRTWSGMITSAPTQLQLLRDILLVLDPLSLTNCHIHLSNWFNLND